MRVLVVREIATRHTALTALLENEGYVVESVEAGPESLRAARVSRPDAIVVDIPRASPGFEVAQILRSAAAAPCMLLTCEPRPDVRAVLQKSDLLPWILFEPYDDDQILGVLARACAPSAGALHETAGV